MKSIQACLVLNPFTSCDELSNTEISIACDSGDCSLGRSNPNICFDVEVGDEKGCVSYNNSTRSVSRTKSWNEVALCATYSAQGPCNGASGCSWRSSSCEGTPTPEAGTCASGAGTCS